MNTPVEQLKAEPRVGMLNSAARREEFRRMPSHMQAKVAAVLQVCAEKSLSVRCDNVDGDVYVIIGRGLSSPRHWQEMFGLIPRGLT